MTYRASVRATPYGQGTQGCEAVRPYFSCPGGIRDLAVWRYQLSAFLSGASGNNSSVCLFHLGIGHESTMFGHAVSLGKRFFLQVGTELFVRF